MEGGTEVAISDGLSHIRMYVSDIDRSLEFYTKVFGLEKMFDVTLDGDEYAALTGVDGASNRSAGGRIGDMRLEFNRPSWYPDSPVSPGVGMVGITFQVDDADSAHAECTAMGIPTSGEPTEVMGCRIFFLEDPDGVRLEVVEYLPDSLGWGGEGARPELAARKDNTGTRSRTRLTEEPGPR